LTTKLGGIGDSYQKKREMFVETSYLLLSVNIEYPLKQSIPIKIAGCFVTGSYVPQGALSQLDIRLG